MANKAIMMSIQPKYAEKIFAGSKTVELRRTCPDIREGDLVLIYVSSPVMALCGAFKIDKIVSSHPSELWHRIKSQSGITYDEYNNYFKGASLGFAIYFSDVWTLPNPIHLKQIREYSPGFQPPQSFRYISHEHKELLSAAMVCY